MSETSVGTDLLQVVDVFPEGQNDICSEQVLVLSGGKVFLPVKHPGRDNLFEFSDCSVEFGYFLIRKVPSVAVGSTPAPLQ